MRRLLALSTAAFCLCATGCKESEPEVIYKYKYTNETNRDSGAGRVDPPRIFTEMRVLGFVAWDPTLEEVVPYTYQGDARDSRLELRLYEGPGSDTPFCIVGVSLNGYRQTTVPAGYRWGIDLPAGEKPSFETCTNDGWDTDQFPIPIEDWQTWDWHLRFHSPLEPDLVDWLTPDNPPPEFDLDDYTGGLLSTDAGSTNTDPDNNFWYGYEVDANFDVDVNTSTPLKASSTMLDSNMNMARGYYVLDQTVYFNNFTR